MLNIKNIQNIHIEDFDYPLPDPLIAKHPLTQRDACKMILSDTRGNISHHHFYDLTDILADTSPLIVCNETKVINARLEFFKTTGSRIEIFLLEPHLPADYAQAFATNSTCAWKCLVGNLKKWKGAPLVKTILINDSPSAQTETIQLEARLLESQGNTHIIEFTWTGNTTFASVVEAAGNIPIPPYLNRASEPSDTTDYQTVFSRVKGSVAAPTAGLHFTPQLLDKLQSQGARIDKVTLHVGAGTFQPVKSADIGHHPMHTETVDVPLKVIEDIIEAKRHGQPILAVGTTSVRTLESLPLFARLAMTADVTDPKAMHVDQWTAYQHPADSPIDDNDTIGLLESLCDTLRRHSLTSLQGSTQIMIAPGFRWRVVDIIITNFHQPQSTLLLLVSSFMEQGILHPHHWRRLYEEALRLQYRFLSYGDACLLYPKKEGHTTSDTRSFAKDTAISLPPSKSIALRAMALKCAGALRDYLDNPHCDTTAIGDCDCPDLLHHSGTDIKGFADAIQTLLTQQRHSFSSPIAIHIGEGAAPLRFFTAIAASTPGCDITLTGAPRLCERPVAPLVDALRAAGANIEYTGTPGCAPLHIRGKRLAPSSIEVDTSASSQYISALMLAAPLWPQRPEIKITGDKTVSTPYIRMTEDVIRRMHDHTLRIEADWSAASYFYAYTLLTGRSVHIASLTPPELSLQGDAACADIFRQAGVLTEYHADGSASISKDKGRLGADTDSILEFDLKDTPDLAPAICVAFTLAGIRFTLHGITHLRIKECDRISALITELRKIGFMLHTGTDDHGEWLGWHGTRTTPDDTPDIHTYSDHRIAMAFAIARTAMPQIVIQHPEVVEKSFPHFFTELDKLMKA